MKVIDMRNPRISTGLHLGVDATNIRQGGGLTHLSQIFAASDLNDHPISHVTVWCGKATSDSLPNFPWLTKICPFWADAKLPLRMLGQQLALLPAVKAAGCDVLFSPGGTLPIICSVPVVTMSQNMLPFEPVEAARFGRWSAMWLKIQLLRITQEHSYKKADGLIFLTKYARTTVLSVVGDVRGSVATIPHGVEARFKAAPRPQRGLESYSFSDPFCLLYVSILMPYKHHLEVARAVSLLRSEGFPLTIRFVGAGWGKFGRDFAAFLEGLNGDDTYLHWSGSLPFDKLHEAYKAVDAFVFASSCENLPNILIEAMSAGLPVACSKSGPMPEVLGDAGLYFDPESPSSIATSLRHLIQSRELREGLALKASKRAQEYSWRRCAKETFNFIANVARQ